jgi:DNA-binding NarL/FixJ family response regulator
MEKIRVLIAEDHETVRAGLRLLLEAEHDIEVIGEAPEGRSAVERVSALQPHVVVLDVSMPGMNGFDAAKVIKQLAPKVAIVGLTRHDDDAFVQELMSAGALAYVLKQSSTVELLSAIKAAAKGDRYLDTSLKTRQVRDDRPRGAGPHQPSVSIREMRVLRMMALGQSNKEIAAELKISVKTVEVHKANAMRKLGMRGRADVVRFGILHGWLRDP